MSTQRESTKGPNNGFMESSVDPPSAEHEKISQVIQEVHDCIPSRDDIPVPHELSPNMREHPFQLRKEDFGEFFHVEEAVMIFEKRELPRAELVMMYLRAFHNILEYDLGRVMELQKRMIRQLGTILADVLELCYPNLEGPQLVCNVNAVYSLISRFYLIHVRTLQKLYTAWIIVMVIANIPRPMEVLVHS